VPSSLATKAVEPTAHEQFAALSRDTADRLATLAHQWAAEYWSASGFAAEMDAILLEAHTAAVVIGRQHAGDLAPLEDDDRLFAQGVMAGEHDFLTSFREQMELGKYTTDGVRDGDAVARRVVSYGGRVTGTANQAFTATLPEDAEVWWQLGAEDDSNCDACPAIADGSPYPAHSFDIWPGSNSTPCLQNCRCSLQTGEGLTGFTTP
jgi:hypothetical protein